MTSYELEQQVIEILMKLLGTSGLGEPDDDLVNLGLDSMKAVALIVELEEAFNIMFDDNDLIFSLFSTRTKIVQRVSDKLKMNESISS